MTEKKPDEVRDEFFETVEQMIEDLENEEYSEYLIWGVANESNRKTAISALKELRDRFVDIDAEIFINGEPVSQAFDSKKGLPDEDEWTKDLENKEKKVGGLPTAAIEEKCVECGMVDLVYSTDYEGRGSNCSNPESKDQELVRRKDIKDRVKGLKQFFEDRRQKYFDEGNHVVNPQAVNELEKARNKVEELLEELKQ